MARSGYEFHPLTKDRWRDLETLFGERGACGGCWCMWWRVPKAEFVERKGEGNRKALRALVAKGAQLGLLAYAGGEPVGWCAFAPREDYVRLAKARTLKPVDDQPVWSVTCFFIARGHRGRGLSVALLDAAAEHAARNGARILEGYPTATESRLPAAFVYTGLPSSFERAGFVEVARRARTRPIMRRALRRPRSS
ncbi:MAG: GNAT family N-acetyltransferase [Acidobacteria bacterium]|nr:GNAT family N-acetyltransferase [Acidobacteriota bacterium]